MTAQAQPIPCARCALLEAEVERGNEETVTLGDYEKLLSERDARRSDQEVAQRQVGKAWLHIARIADACTAVKWTPADQHKELRIAIGAASRCALAGMLSRSEFIEWLLLGLGQK